MTMLLTVLSFMFSAASIPVDGFPGVSLAAIGVVLGFTAWRRAKASVRSKGE